MDHFAFQKCLQSSLFLFVSLDVLYCLILTRKHTFPEVLRLKVFLYLYIYTFLYIPLYNEALMTCYKR
ncbi:hypothetical protein BDF14DRAFT_1847822 [Spinellus fusiger]|nr:hypothetical protein BDF14DRAFT_1847822 [Spinellus fusiger]